MIYKIKYKQLLKEFKDMVDIKNKAILERDNRIKEFASYEFELMERIEKLEKKLNKYTDKPKKVSKNVKEK